MPRVGDLLFDTIRGRAPERATAHRAEGVRIQPAALGDDAGVPDGIATRFEYGCN